MYIFPFPPSQFVFTVDIVLHLTGRLFLYQCTSKCLFPFNRWIALHCIFCSLWWLMFLWILQRVLRSVTVHIHHLVYASVQGFSALAPLSFGAGWFFAVRGDLRITGCLAVSLSLHSLPVAPHPKSWQLKMSANITKWWGECWGRGEKLGGGNGPWLKTAVLIYLFLFVCFVS